MAPSNVHPSTPQSWSSLSPQTVANYNGTLQWHHVHSSKVGPHHPPLPPPQWHPAMEPRPKVGLYPTIEWHPAMAPRPLPQSWSSPSPLTIAHCNGTLRWHSNAAPCNGTLVPRPIRQSGSSPSPPIGSKNPDSCRYLEKMPPPTIAHYNGTLQWHPATSTVHSPKVGRHPPPKP